MEEAAKAAAEYNKMINRERSELRRSYFDIQTFAVHYPKTGTCTTGTLLTCKYTCRFILHGPTWAAQRTSVIVFRIGLVLSLGLVSVDVVTWVKL